MSSNINKYIIRKLDNMFDTLKDYSKLTGDIGYYYILELTKCGDDTNTYIKCGITQQKLINRLKQYTVSSCDNVVTKYTVFKVKKFRILEKTVLAHYGRYIDKGNEYIKCYNGVGYSVCYDDMNYNVVNYYSVVKYVKGVIEKSGLEVE